MNLTQQQARQSPRFRNESQGDWILVLLVPELFSFVCRMFRLATVGLPCLSFCHYKFIVMLLADHLSGKIFLSDKFMAAFQASISSWRSTHTKQRNIPIKLAALRPPSELMSSNVGCKKQVEAPCQSTQGDTIASFHRVSLTDE